MEAVLERKLEGKHVLMMLIGFFSFMLIANGFFVYFALTSFSGLSTDDAYRKGLHYNDSLEALELQKARGWQVALDIDAPGDRQFALSLEIKDKNGDVLPLNVASAQLKRPAIKGQDILLNLVNTGSVYEVSQQLPSAGQWDVKILMSGGGYEVPYRVEKRIWVK